MLDGIIARDLRSGRAFNWPPPASKYQSARRIELPFTDAVLAHIVRVFVASGDRNALVKLLSTRFPPRLGYGDAIEWYLVIFGKKLKREPIMVLGEAYSKCQIPDMHHDIASALRRAFTDLGVRGKDNADFVRTPRGGTRRKRTLLSPILGIITTTGPFPGNLQQVSRPIHDTRERATGVV